MEKSRNVKSMYQYRVKSQTSNARGSFNSDTQTNLNASLGGSPANPLRRFGTRTTATTATTTSSRAAPPSPKSPNLDVHAEEIGAGGLPSPQVLHTAR
jgi:hypothetical protein